MVVEKNIDSEKINRIVQAALEDMKAKDILSIDVRSLTGITDYMVIASGNSSRHVKAIADNVLREAKKRKVPVIGVEGEAAAEWILVDFGDVVVHVMQEHTRAFYDLEKLWSQPRSEAGDG